MFVSTHSARFAALRLVTTLSLAALLLAACSDDAASGADTGTADSGGDTSGDQGDSDTADATGTEWSATLYRVESLIIDQPASLGPLIGQLVSRDIRNGLLNILVETANFDAASGATTFEMRGGAGESPDSGTTYRLSTEVAYVPASVDADGNFENTVPLTLDFPVLLTLPPDCGEQDCPDDRCRNDDDCVGLYTCDLEGDGQCVQSIVLPLKDIVLSGTFTTTDGAPTLELAELEGALLKEDTDQIEVGLPGADPLLLTGLLGEQRMDYPDRDNPTGWQLSALINATAVTPVPAE